MDKKKAKDKKRMKSNRYIAFLIVLILIGSTIISVVSSISPVSADGPQYMNTGGTITTNGSYTYHVFNLAKTGTNFSVGGSGNIEILVVAGGGAGARGGTSGGGGSGGLVYHSSKAVTTGNYTITVGNGGQTYGSSGGNSSFSDILALGGGGGGLSSPGNNGGCGGGGSQVGQAGGVATQGNSGGGTGFGQNGGPGINVYGGGGGGVGAVGGTPSGGRGGAGGSGTSNYSSILSIVGIGKNVSDTWWIGGGGGGNYQAGSDNTGGAGGLGGGGNAYAYSSNSVATDGLSNTGSGGGAGNPSGTTFGKGGSGIVIIKCLTSDFTPSVIVYLTTSSGSGGDVTTPGEGTYTYNTSEVVNISATVDACYHFVNWTGNTSDIGNTSAASTNISMGSVNKSATANFAINTSTISYSAGSGGTIDGTLSQIVNCGASTMSVTATPNSCYHFTNWNDANISATRSDIGTSANQSFIANFEIDTKTIDYMSGDHGSIIGTLSQIVNCGNNGSQVTADPDSCYHFVNWSDSSYQNPRTDINVLSNVSVTANFAIDVFTVTYLSGLHGSINGSWPQNINCHDDGDWVLATPSDGYYFSRWSDDSIVNPRHESNVTSNLSYTANFALSGTNASAVIPPSGGIITTADGDVSILFPNGAFSVNTTVMIEGISCNPSTDDYIVAGTCFRVDSDNDLNAPAKICVNVLGYDKDNITIGYWSISGWVEIDDIYLNNNLLCGNTSHFSDWSILYKNINTSGSDTIDSMVGLLPVILMAIVIVATTALIAIGGGFSIAALITAALFMIIGLAMVGTLTNLVANLW